MKTLTISLRLVTFLTLAACAPNVIDGAGQSNNNLNGGEETTTSGTPGAGGGSTGPSAVAMRYADIPWSEPGDSGSSVAVTSGGSGIDPDTLYVFLGAPSPSCEVPNPTTWCSGWSVSIGIPPELQVPGVISLDDPRLIASHSVSGHNEGSSDPEDCWGGGGSFFAGTIEIVSIDASALEIVLADTQAFEIDADGVYDVARCQ